MTEEAKLIVKTLRACAVETQCSKCVVFCGNDECLFTAAAKLIESLSEQLEETVSKLETVTRERDAAVEYVKSLCATNYFSGNFCYYCKYNEPDGQCHHHCIPYSNEWGWQWRGAEVSE